MDNVLEINLSENYKIKIDSLEDLKKDNVFFKEAYKSASRSLVEIIEASNETNQSERNNLRQDNSGKVKRNIAGENNNIIAFCGERGTGKTSAMVSFAGFLSAKEGIERLSEKVYTKLDIIKDVNFYNLRVIDPSLFEDGENIFEIIISELFSDFKNKLEKRTSQDNFQNEDSKRKLLKLFDKVYKSIKVLKKPNELYNGESLETLDKLALGSNLRKNTKELVKEYLRFIDSNKGIENQFLVIPIDDFDLNIRNATEMAEQIRKYLMIPNVIILMAVNMDQLTQVKEQSLWSEFSTLNKVNRLEDDPKKMTERYLLKLIPEQRRVMLPDLKVIGKDVKVSVLGAVNEMEEYKNETLEEYILRLIYNKTGLIFIRPRYSTHYFVPKTLREVREILIFLDSLEKIEGGDSREDTGKDYKDAIKNNFEKFKNFFYNSWVKSNLSGELLKVVDDFLVADISVKNKFIIRRTISALRKICRIEDKESDIDVITKHSKSEEADYLELNNIISPDNYPQNVSLGDVLFFLKQLKKYRESDQIYKYVYAIETTYSFMFYELMKLKDPKEGKVKEKLKSLINTFINVPNCGSDSHVRNKSIIDFDNSTYDKIVNRNISREFINVSNTQYSDRKDFFVSKGKLDLKKNNRNKDNYLDYSEGSNYTYYSYYLYKIFYSDDKYYDSVTLYSIESLRYILNFKVDRCDAITKKINDRIKSINKDNKWDEKKGNIIKELEEKDINGKIDTYNKILSEVDGIKDYNSKLNKIVKELNSIINNTDITTLSAFNSKSINISKEIKDIEFENTLFKNIKSKISEDLKTNRFKYKNPKTQKEKIISKEDEKEMKIDVETIDKELNRRKSEINKIIEKINTKFRVKIDEDNNEK